MGSVRGRRFFRGATTALALLLAAFLLAVAYARVAPPSPSLGSFLAVGKLLVQMALVGLLAVVALRLSARLPARYLFVLACTVATVVYHFGRFPPWGLFWTIVFAIVPATLAGGALLSRGRLAKVLGLLGAFVLALGLVLFLRDGWSVPAPENAALVSGSPRDVLALPSPRLRGPHEVERFTYGSGKDRHRREFASDADLRTEPVDGAKLVENWEGWSGWARTQYWGFDATALPLQGRVWCPLGAGPFPLVLVVHGNHAMEDFSDGGYAYLGELLASRGIVTVSVDENFINSSFSGRLDELFGRGLRTENDARGWLLLKHLEQWRRWNETEGNPFSGRIDLDRVGLVGHSRGGEAVAVAAFFNDLDRYPDDANLGFDFGFGLRGVVAIAPVDGQYEPAGRGTPIRNVDYFVLHGSHDGDVQSFAGSRQLERVRFDDGRFHFKSALYVYGANHGQFNTTWGRSDASFPGKRFLNLAQILPEEDQRRIGETYVSAFFEIVLKDEPRYLPLFRDWRSGREWLPESILLSHYRDSTERDIASFDEDLDVTTTTFPGGELRGEGLSTWKERLVELKYGDKATSAVVLGWGASEDEEAGDEDTSGEDVPPAHYSITVPEGLSPSAEDAIVFSLADAREEDGEDEPIDFTLELRDEHSSAARVLSDFAPLQPRLRVQVSKSALFNDTATSEPVYQSYAFPLSDFEGLDPARLREIRFVFDRTERGVILLDDLAFRPR